jgi:chromosome segregation ATPase
MTTSPRPSLSEADSEPGRLVGLERNMAVMEHRLTFMENRHESVPIRVTKLEQQFEHMSGQLSELNEGQQKLTSVVAGIGNKITWALAVASTLWAILQMFGPVLLRVFVP